MTFAMLYKRFSIPGESPEAFYERWTREQQDLLDAEIQLPINDEELA